MKIHLFLISVFLMLSPILLTSCHSNKDLVYKETRDIKLEKIGFAGVVLKADLLYYNPNNFSLELNQTDLDIYINQTYLGHTKQNVQIKIPRKQDFILPIHIDLDTKNLLKNGLTTLISKEVKVNVKGSVKVGKAGIFTSFPVDFTTTQKVPSLF